MANQGALLAQQMRDLQIHRHEIEIRRLKANPGDPLAGPFLRALDAALTAADIVEAYVTPSPVGRGHEPAWSLALFSERQLPAGQQIEMIVAAQEVSNSFEITMAIFCWSENAMELAEAMAIGIRIWPMNDTLHKEE